MQIVIFSIHKILFISVLALAASCGGKISLKDNSTIINQVLSLSFYYQPTPFQQGTIITPSIKISLVNNFGNVVETFNKPVTISFTASGNPNGAALGGTLMRQAINGIATFDDITISDSSDYYQLSATFLGQNIESLRFSSYPSTPIFRSVGPANLGVLANGSANSLTISGATGTFSNYLPLNVGVGDVVIYNGGGNLAFIHGRANSKVYQIRSSAGANPVAVSNDTSFEIYRAHASLADATNLIENTNIAVDFDPSANGKDIQASGETWIMACYGNGSADILPVRVAGWDTSELNFIKIFTPSRGNEVGITQRHQGVWDSDKYTLEITDNGGPSFYEPIRIEEDNLKIDGLQINYINYDGALAADENSGQAISTFDVALTASTSFYISNNIIKATTQDVDGDNQVGGIVMEQNSGINRIWNNIIYDFDLEWPSVGIRVDADAHIYNNTVYNSTIGIRQIGGVSIAKNNIVQNSPTTYQGAYDSSSAKNISDNGTSPNNANDYLNITLNFLDIGNKDFHLADSDIEAIGFGENLSSDATAPLILDIDGQPRNFNFDIGADQLNSAL